MTSATLPLATRVLTCSLYMFCLIPARASARWQRPGTTVTSATRSTRMTRMTVPRIWPSSRNRPRTRGTVANARQPHGLTVIIVKVGCLTSVTRSTVSSSLFLTLNRFRTPDKDYLLNSNLAKYHSPFLSCLGWPSLVCLGTLLLFFYE